VPDWLKPQTATSQAPTGSISLRREQMKFTSDLQVTNRNVFQLVFAASLLALVFSAAIVRADAQSNTYADNFGKSASIEGSWIFNIDVSLDQQPIATFNSLISFGAGGIVVTSPSTSPLTILYGAWSPMKSNSFSSVFYAFAPDSTGTGVVLQRLRIRSHLTDQNNLAGTGGRSTCNLQGENCVDDPIVFQFTGKRIASRVE
jgi:hypothetical protein